MGEWQPIETAPRDGTWILTARDYRHIGEGWEMSTGYWQPDLEFFTNDGGDNVGDKGDYWMPLPDPPTTEA